ncbi:MAG: ABC transporter ATP-binding protein [Candidatus Hydrogenedentes bacterium]|nr:ABC transporter ATP-binding protein [Candidatus Hydrogenedentota bacterium]
MSAVLEARGIAHAYEQGATILDNVSASLGDGEFVTIVGPNGCGKSTLLRILAGVLSPTSGNVLINGKPALSIAIRERARRVGFLPQTVNPIFSMRVIEVVQLGRFPHLGVFGTLAAHDHAIVDRCLGDTETRALRHRDFLSLSGGERQRVLLASVLAQEPRVLLLDEPTSALDIHHQIEILALLRRLCAGGYGIAAVTHDINLAARFSHRMLVMGHASRGIMASGPPVEVVTEPLLSEAYGAPIRVCMHPITGTPLVTVDVAQPVTP